MWAVDSVLLLSAGYLGFKYYQAQSTQESFLSFDGFPFFLGEELRGTLTPQPPLAPNSTVKLELRCVEEQQIEVGTGEDRRIEIHSFKIYSEIKIFEDLGGPFQYRSDLVVQALLK